MINNDNSINPTSLQDIGLGISQPSKANDNGQTDFLNLFVAQLQNQDPLEPQDGSQMLSQLAQFSQVEGISNLDASFKELAASLQSNQALQAANMVGRQVELASSTGLLTGQGLQGSVEVPEGVSDVTLEFRNQQGELVKTMNLTGVEDGFAPFSWNGLSDNGDALEQGNYSVTAKTLFAGETTQLATYVKANVDSVTVDKNNQSLILNVAGYGSATMNDIRNIS